jgi:hypothetical protein
MALNPPPEPETAMIGTSCSSISDSGTPMNFANEGFAKRMRSVLNCCSSGLMWLLLLREYT